MRDVLKAVKELGYQPSSALTQEWTTVATLAESGKLPDVDLAEGDLKITPLRAVTPPEGESLRDAAYNLLPRIKITDLLLEVDRWTGFSECFTHRRYGQPPPGYLWSPLLTIGDNRPRQH